MQSYILVDKSGSMKANWAETIGAINGYVETLDETKGMGKTKVTVAAFDSHGAMDYQIVRDEVKAKNWATIAENEVQARGMTPLYDAVGKMHSQIVESGPKKASVLIITDGHENSSKEITREVCGSIIKEWRDKGFDVVFMGADFDAFGQSEQVGVGVRQTINTTKGNYAATMTAMATRTTAYAASGKVAAFSDADREAAQGK